MVTSKQQQTKQEVLEESRDLQKQPDRITDADSTSKLKNSDLALIQEYESKMRELLTGELSTHFALNYTVGNYYKEMVVKFCNQLLEEYSCKTPSEIALAEIAASSFARYLDYSDLLSEISHKPFNKMINTSFSVLSKEVDRAYRAYVSAILTLKQLKNPPLKVRIKTTNAFIAQNQQINAEKRV